jgi:hypothetical protein
MQQVNINAFAIRENAVWELQPNSFLKLSQSVRRRIVGAFAPPAQTTGMITELPHGQTGSIGKRARAHPAAIAEDREDFGWTFADA